MLTVTCPCGRAYRVDEKHAGKKIKCKQCGQLLLVPGDAPVMASRATPPNDYIMASAAAPEPVFVPGPPPTSWPTHAPAPLPPPQAPMHDAFAGFGNANSTWAPEYDGRPATAGVTSESEARGSFPFWTWFFVAGCGILPVLTLGGGIPIAIAGAGIGGVLGIARHRTLSIGAKLGSCIAITLGCWFAVGTLLVIVAMAMTRGTIPNAANQGNQPSNSSSSSSGTKQKTKSGAAGKKPSGSTNKSQSPNNNSGFPSWPGATPAEPSNPPGPIASVDAALKALSQNDGPRAIEALNWLATVPRDRVSPSEAKRVTTLVSPKANGPDRWQREPAAKVFCRFAGVSDVNRLEEMALLPELEFAHCWGPAMATLVQLDPPRASRVLERRVEELFFRVRALGDMEKVEGGYEPVVWPLLKNEKRQVREIAIGILGDMGTERSIERINQTYAAGSDQDKFFLKGIVERAVAKIRARNQ